MTRAMRRMRKYLLVVACVALVAGLAIGGTVAWLVDTTPEVKNTFTPTEIDIVLDETVPADKEAEMVPGATIAKDPYVQVVKGSESCYVYVEIVPSENLGTYIAYDVNKDDWTELKGVTGSNGGKVYYYNNAVTVTDTADSDKLYILQKDTTNKNGYVTVNGTVTAEQMTDAETNKPTLSFYAYAIQSENIGDQTAAWNAVYNTASGT